MVRDEFELNVTDAENGGDDLPVLTSTPSLARASGPTGERKLIGMSLGNLMLVGLFTAGIAGVYVLSLQQGPASASAQERQNEMRVETALSMINNQTFAGQSRKAQEIVDTFYQEARLRQIPLGKLAGNPFVYSPPRPVEAPAETPAASKKDPLVVAIEQAREAVKDLELQSVLKGQHGSTAMISSNLLTEGQVIRGWTVSKIGPREVVLTWKEHTHVLRMQR